VGHSPIDDERRWTILIVLLSFLVFNYNNSTGFFCSSFSMILEDHLKLCTKLGVNIYYLYVFYICKCFLEHRGKQKSPRRTTFATRDNFLSNDQSFDPACIHLRYLLLETLTIMLIKCNVKLECRVIRNLQSLEKQILPLPLQAFGNAD